MPDFNSYLPQNLSIGTAGWSLPRSARDEFPEEGTQLERYASVFHAVEINSSFQRSHKRATYQRWAESVPDSFRFSVKVPKAITHVNRLASSAELLDRFLEEVSGLGSKLGCLLVQLPPSLEFDPEIAEPYFNELRALHSGAVVVEPRHKTWFAQIPNRMLRGLCMSRVAADPAEFPTAADPGGSASTVYYRLHGSPQMYYSAYTTSYLDGLAFRLRMYSRTQLPAWCMFDNTIRGEATLNALYVTRKVALEEMGAAR